MDFIVTKKPISSIGGHRCFEMYKIRYSGSNTFKCLKALTYTKFLKSVLVVLNLKIYIQVIIEASRQMCKNERKTMMALLDIHFWANICILQNTCTIYVQYTKAFQSDCPFKLHVLYTVRTIYKTFLV